MRAGRTLLLLSILTRAGVICLLCYLAFLTHYHNLYLDNQYLLPLLAPFDCKRVGDPQMKRHSYLALPSLGRLAD